MACGDEGAFHAVLPIFQVLGKVVTYTGPQGTGQLTKCVNQILVALNCIAMTEALAFLERTPLDVKKTVSVVGAGSASSWALNNYGPRVLKGDLSPGFRAVDMLKDIKIVLDEAEQMHLSLPGMELMKRLFETLCSAQKESLGIHGLIKLYK
ncbi:MAG: NAD(P)-dependent oxidoreductase [SAR324 cluster bacterium]|uniref:NAD(P)-dependent oxidoreductase n=1 Tax=SAR324 cluster bacterium TaxID=2024889 RepID=A0A7X9FTG2_9DELT|nr:NAD(P)-dependent oxidoreductase [SAR324 cluster bacterium]